MEVVATYHNPAITSGAIFRVTQLLHPIFPQRGTEAITTLPRIVLHYRRLVHDKKLCLGRDEYALDALRGSARVNQDIC